MSPNTAEPNPPPERESSHYERPVTSVPPGPGGGEAVTPCPVCDATAATPRFAVADLPARVVVCTGCGLGRLYPLPSPDEVRALYPDAYYGEPQTGKKFYPLIEGLVRRVGARHIDFLAQGLPPGARVLDVGCGRGVILGALADRGLEVHGVEISAEAARGADPRARIHIAPRLVEVGLSAESFDFVAIWHVLEHLSDPLATLCEARRILKPGGRLVVAVPNFSSFQARWAGPAWFHLDLPRHLFHFPAAALRRILERAGFAVESEHHFSLRQNPFGWLQSALNLLPSLPRNGLYVLLHRRAPGGAPPYDAPTRRKLWLGLIAGAPVAVMAAVTAALLRRGATVHVRARAVS